MTRRTKKKRTSSSPSGASPAKPAPGSQLRPPLPAGSPSAAPTGRPPPRKRRSGPPQPSALDRLSLRHDLTPPRAEWDALIPVAKLGKTWGVHGDITVRLYNPDSELAWAADVLLIRGDGFPLVAVEIDRWQTKGSLVIIRPVGITAPQIAKALTGFEILVPPDDLPEIEDDDEFYVHELMGMTVTDTERGELGTIREVFTAGASDVWVVRGEAGEVLIPALKQFVLEVDRDARQITVRYELD